MRLSTFLLIVVCSVFVWSGIAPHDRFTWFMEVFPVIFGVPIIFLTRKTCPLSALSLTLLAIHAIILMVGGHYTYAEVPLFNWIRDSFGLARNDYDRVGHFAQGFVPAVVGREVLLRKTRLEPGMWLNIIVVSICLAISASYELLEWATAVFSGTAADAFLGTQGDVWDTQKDMATALVGAVLGAMVRSQGGRQKAESRRQK